MQQAPTRPVTNAPGNIRVEVIRAWPRRFAAVTLQLQAGARVADALAASGLPRHDGDGYAVFGRRVAPTDVLRDGDRLELLPPLRIDPKQARRQRAARQ